MKVIKEWIGVLLMLCLSIGLWPVQAKATAYTIYWPLSTSYKITNSFSNHPSKDGVDMATSGNMPEVYAVEGGTAYFYQVQAIIDGSSYLVSYGNLVELKWGNNTAIYAHLSSFNGITAPISSSMTKRLSYSECKQNGYEYSKKLIATKNVAEGDVLGNVGTTGNSTGCHLHFGLKIDGSHVDPAGYLLNSMSAKDHANAAGEVTEAHTSDSRYSEFVPFKSYAVNTENISVYNENGIKYSNRYITGSSDLCIINDVYTDGWCQVTYPSSAEASGYFTAYILLSEFIPNTSPSEAIAVSGGMVYRRSSGNDTIGSISSGEKCLKLSDDNGRTQVIFAVNDESHSEAGWVDESVFDKDNVSNVTPSDIYKVPCRAYAISNEKVTVYNKKHSAYSLNDYYIDGANTLCTIDIIYTDGWCQVTYQTNSGSFTAYVPTSVFISGFERVQNWRAEENYMTYRKSSGSEKMGNVSSSDACLKVASENGRIQVMYPINEESYYEMGWIDLDVQQGTCGTNLKWQLNKEGVLTISGTGTMKNYTYKSEMPWYKYINDIQSVVIEDGVTSIGDYAFYGMSKLTDISIPEGVKTIGEYAFKNCAALDGVNLPSTLTKLGQSAFYGCTSLSSIAIPEGLYTVWGYTFKNCTSLAEVTLPSTLIKIDEAAFYGCKTLKTLDIPDSVSIIGIYCFKNCSSLSEVSLPEKLTQIREAAFYGTAIKTLSVPEGVTTVGPYAFKNCTALKSIELPQSLKKIDEAAFYACDHLAALNVPEKVESIGNYAFRRCEELQSVSFPESLKTIGESAFYGCGSLSELTIPEGVTSIGGYAFKSCVNLYEVTLPTTLKTLGESAFYGCTRISSMTIPENVATIGAYAFSRCSSLSEVIFTGNAPTIGDYAFAKVTADVRYPGDNSTWTEDKLQNYGGKLTWIADGGKTVAEESMETEEQIVETVESENDTVYETEVEETVQEDETTEDTQQSEETVLETEQGTDSAEEGIAESIDE